MKAVLLAESENDVAFIGAVMQRIGILQESIAARTIRERKKDQPDIPVGGYNEKDLGLAIRSFLLDPTAHGTEKIGIIVDADDSEQKKKDAVAGILATAAEQGLCEITQTWNGEIATVKVPDYAADIEVRLYIMGNETTTIELDGVLRAIKQQPSPLADCADAKLRECPDGVTEKELRKLWLNFYLRYDTCKKGQGNAGEKCNHEKMHYIFQTKNYADPANPIFDLDSPLLNELKSFLTALAHA